MGSYAVILSGASGSVYGLRLTERLLAASHEVAFIATEAGRRVMEHETGFRLPESGGRDELLRFLELGASGDLRVPHHADLFDPLASGSRVPDAVVVIPASMGFVGSLASGLASDLAERACDVALKERRTLVVVPRETPLSLVHLRNLTALAEAGAVVVPAMPAFYHAPKTLDDQVNFIVGKVLDVLGVQHDLYERWRR